MGTRAKHAGTIKKRTLPVLWLSLATFLVALLANLPLIYSFLAVHGTYIWNLWGYAPHQFLFLLVPLPAATFATFTALTIIIGTLSANPDAHSFLRWCGTNWVAIVLLGFIISTTIALFDYYGNPKVFDRLHAEYAEKAAQSALEIRARAAGELADDEAQLSPKTSNLLFYSYKGDRGIDVSKEEILKLDPLTFVRVAIDGELQRRFALLHPVSHLLSELQLVFVLFVGFAALFASSLLFWSYFSPGTDLSTATPAVVTALSFFALYPLCFGYWSAEIAVITGAPVNNVGYLVVGMLILLLGILLTIMDANMRSVVGSLGRALPAILSVIGLGATSIFGVEKLRVLIGIDANVATRFSVLIGMLVIGLILCAMLVIRYEEGFTHD